MDNVGYKQRIYLFNDDTRRRVYRCRPDGQPILDSVIVAIDFHEIKAD